MEYCYIQNPESTEENPLPEIKTLVKKNFFSYDKQNRILSDEEIFYDKKKKVKKFIEKKMFIVIQAKVKMRILNFMKTEI